MPEIRIEMSLIIRNFIIRAKFNNLCANLSTNTQIKQVCSLLLIFWTIVSLCNLDTLSLHNAIEIKKSGLIVIVLNVVVEGFKVNIDWIVCALCGALAGWLG